MKMWSNSAKSLFFHIVTWKVEKSWILEQKDYSLNKERILKMTIKAAEVLLQPLPISTSTIRVAIFPEE